LLLTEVLGVRCGRVKATLLSPLPLWERVALRSKAG
jgi:hypothetical protein